MKPLPPIVLQLLESLPEETHKVILNTNGKGHWEVETFARYRVDEPAEVSRSRASAQAYRPLPLDY